MLKKVYCRLKNWMLVIGVLAASVFYLLHSLLNMLNFEFRQWLIYSVIFISLILIIAGLFQLLFKIKIKAVKIALTTILSIVLLLSSPYMIMLTGFSYCPEHVVTKDGIKLVGYVNGFMHTEVKYYNYKSLFIRGSRLRLYEDYGEGGFDPICNSQGLTYTVKSYTWYDDNGNSLK